MCRGILPGTTRMTSKRKSRRPPVAERREPGFRRRGDALLLTRTHRFRRRVEIGARLHLDEDQQLVAARDDVDLAGRAAPAPRQDAEALGDQRARRRGFRRKCRRERRHFFRTRFALLSRPAACRAPTAWAAAVSAHSPAIAGLFAQLERALIDLAARPPGGERHFADRILHRYARERVAATNRRPRRPPLPLRSAAPPRSRSRRASRRLARSRARASRDRRAAPPRAAWSARGRPRAARGPRPAARSASVAASRGPLS